MNHHIEHYYIASTHSTQTEILNFVKDYKADTKRVVALRTDHQFTGRGQRSHVWESRDKENILTSIYIEPQLAASQQFLISQISALALRDFIANHCQRNIYIKWPNDIYVEDRKIAGILIEHSLHANTLQHSIIGMGININQASFSASLPNPTSLFLETQQTFDIATLHQELLALFAQHYENISQIQNIRDNYLSHLYLKDKPIQLIQNGITTPGQITGVDSFGQLIIKTADREIFLNDSAGVKIINE